MRLMDGEHIGPFNLGNPGEFTMLELAQVRSLHWCFGLVFSVLCVESSFLLRDTNQFAPFGSYNKL